MPIGECQPSCQIMFAPLQRGANGHDELRGERERALSGENKQTRKASSCRHHPLTPVRLSRRFETPDRLPCSQVEGHHAVWLVAMALIITVNLALGSPRG